MTLLIYVKRLLMHLGVVLMLVSLPVLAWIFKDFAQKSDGAEVGIYSSSSEITEYLEQNRDAFHFKTYDSVDTMKRDVETEILECGFILPDDLSDIENIKIVCGVGYSSILSEVTKEAVFAAILKVYGDKAALSFAKKSNIDITDEGFEVSYKNYVSKTMSSVEFEEVPSAPETQTQKKSMVQCIIAAILSCAVLIGSSFYIRDRKKGVVFGAGRCAAASLMLFSISVIASAVIYGTDINILRFILLLCGLWGAGCIFSKTVKDERLPWLMIPLCLTVIFLFDAVDIADILPSLRIVDHFLITHYYIYASIGQLYIFAAVLCICGITADKLIN